MPLPYPPPAPPLHNTNFIMYIYKIFICAKSSYISTRSLNGATAQDGRLASTLNLTLPDHTVCPGSSGLFYILSYYIKCVTTSWTFSRKRNSYFSSKVPNYCLKNYRKSVLQLRTSVMGRLRDLEYIFAVTYETLCI